MQSNEPATSPWLKRAVPLGAAAAILAAIAFKLALPEPYSWSIREDGPFETATCAAYFAASLVASLTAMRLRRRSLPLDAAFYVVLALGFFFVAGEEISWGQRLFGVKAPEYFREHNFQKELNLHNFATSRMVHTAYILLSAYGAIGSFLVPRAWRERAAARVDRLVPQRFLAPLFVPALLLFSYFEYLSPFLVRHWGAQFGWGRTHLLLAKDQEPAELLLAIGYLVFVAVNRSRLAAPRPLPSRA